MRLSASEYAQGLVSWSPIPGLHLRLGRRAADGSLEMSERLPNSSGSLCPFTEQVLTPRFDFTTNDPITTREIWLRIERVVKGVVVTTYAHGLGQLHATLKHVPDYGTYHRLVIDAGELDWDEDLVLREQGILVRFVRGTVECEVTTPFSQAVPVEDGIALEGGEQRTETLEGRFVDIAVPGPSPERAEMQARAVVGLLALTLGPNVLGPVLSSERYEASPDSQMGQVMISTAARIPRAATGGELDVLAGALDRLTVDEPLARARVLALRWYEQAARSKDSLDTLLSSFIGVNALVSAFAAAHGPLPVESERAAAFAPVLELARSLSNKLHERVSGRLLRRTIAEEFEFFADQYALDSDARTSFERVRAARDDALHGRAVDVAPELAGSAERLLRKMLMAILEIGGPLPWESHPAIGEVRLGFMFGDRAARDDQTRA